MSIALYGRDFRGAGVKLWVGRPSAVLDLQSTGRQFHSRHCRVATLGKSFTRAQRLCSYARMAL